MFLCDMHIHSKYSYDGCDTPDDICRAAIARGMRTIAFTDHHDLLPEGMEVSTYEQHDMEARHEIERVRERYAPKLEVLYGIELGEPNTNPAAAERFLQKHPFDFVLGSVHFTFQKGEAIDIYEVDFGSIPYIDVIQDYFNNMLAMIRLGGFHSLAHLDYVYRPMKGVVPAPVLEPWRETVDEVLRLIVRKGIALEISTRGFRDWFGRLSPEEWVLRRFRELGGENVTIGSDTHGIVAVGLGAKDAAEFAKTCGFDYITTYRAGKPVKNKID